MHKFHFICQEQETPPPLNTGLDQFLAGPPPSKKDEREWIIVWSCSLSSPAAIVDGPTTSRKHFSVKDGILSKCQLTAQVQIWI